MKRIIIGILILAALLTACTKQETIGTEQELIGGQTEEYGCLGPAGYSWNSSVGACVREWELDESAREAAKIAVMPLSYRVTVTQVDVLRCPGCFVVHLQRNDNGNQMEIKLIDWKISSENPDENSEMTEIICSDAGGHWNECSNKCQLDNQGKEGMACTAMCEALCECGGIAGFNCPEGYTCKTPNGVADALGYCIKAV
ncbi:hypothetical protein JXC34_00380 [Candidatus Woesearchaeota archaeon]|nr:hypothetical protein [Candidatus Woesearchaeota archaeon]